jgi:hypothetical protein
VGINWRSHGKDRNWAQTPKLHIRAGAGSVCDSAKMRGWLEDTRKASTGDILITNPPVRIVVVERGRFRFEERCIRNRDWSPPRAPPN